MAGSHEVRGSNPLFSTMNSIAGRTIGQRFFISRLEGSNPARLDNSFNPPEGKLSQAGVAGRVQDAPCGGQLGFAPLLSRLFVPVALRSRSSRSSQLRTLRDVAFDCFPVGFPVAR